ncbi:hypothetical protein [Carboxylicivirga sp. N1Y90]|uniref:hypothetical protein n=1 Tax=Carboxylicivirga fragile TaxID=3417571 RepID=UPI003D32D1FB|nr:hypothetical protein [Marinilabiliaceae bacterium N1Y90]
MTAHTCLYCDELIVGRSDKKFCTAQCKSAYHNQNESTSEAYMRTLNKQLRTNRRALHTACPSGKATVRKSFLIKLGMNFKYLTHTWRNQSGTLYYFCYDYGYTPSMESGKVVIIQEQSYMK